VGLVFTALGPIYSATIVIASFCLMQMLFFLQQPVFDYSEPSWNTVILLYWSLGTGFVAKARGFAFVLQYHYPLRVPFRILSLWFWFIKNISGCAITVTGTYGFHYFYSRIGSC